MSDSPFEGNDHHAEQAQANRPDLLADHFPADDAPRIISPDEIIIIIRGTPNPDGGHIWSHATTVPLQHNDFRSATLYDTKPTFTHLFKAVCALLIRLGVQV